MRKPLLSHLDELRKRLILTFVFFVTSSILAYPLAKPLLNKMMSVFYDDVEVILLSPQEALMAAFKTSVFLGMVFSFPVAAHQFWVFIRPGLNQREAGLLKQAFSAGILLFLLGVAFSCLILAPVSLNFLGQTASSIAKPMYSLSESLSFIYTLSLACALAFQMPILTVLTTRIGLTTQTQLKKHRKHVIVASMFFSAVITDPSQITQVLVAAPMIVLYEVGILATYFFGGVK